MEERRSQRPTAEELITKLKDDGDFDNLRLQIIRKVKENEELRNNILIEVKQSDICNQESLENLKPRQLSDAIYQELGKKIMGQISDEVWKVIRNESTRNDIRSTVESVYERIVNPKPKEDDIQPSPIKDNSCKQNGIATTLGHTGEVVMCVESKERMPTEELPRQTNMNDDDDDDMPPGFGMPVSNNVEDNDDKPPGFETVGNVNHMPPGFSNGVAHDDDDDLDVPPGFGEEPGKM